MNKLGKIKRITGLKNFLFLVIMHGFDPNKDKNNGLFQLLDTIGNSVKFLSKNHLLFEKIWDKSKR